MNEYMSSPQTKWGNPSFTDIFPIDSNPNYKQQYYDTPLSSKGLSQVTELNNYVSNMEDGKIILDELDLIVVSPLTRTLQTMELGLMPYLRHSRRRRRRRHTRTNADSNDCTTEKKKMPEIVALPLAAERLYLVSDIGSSVSDLKQQFPYVNFDEMEMNKNSNDAADAADDDDDDDDEWWFTTKSEGQFNSILKKINNNNNNDNNNKVILNQNENENDPPSIQTHANYVPIMKQSDYIEWRPHGQGQSYACAGEPDFIFNQRMELLYDWLQRRSEQNICLICHWGVIRWLVGKEFENCEVQVYDFESIQRQPSKL